jgi:hypothetical protein
MSVQLWIPLFCGLSIGVGDRTPTILYRDVFLPGGLAYQIYCRGVIPDFKDRTITHLANGAIPYLNQVPSPPSFPCTV